MRVLAAFAGLCLFGLGGMAYADILDDAAQAVLAEDDESARTLYQQGCDQDIVDACMELAQMQWYGRGGPQDAAAARATLDKGVALARAGCSAGKAADCWSLGQATHDHSGSEADKAGLAALQKAEEIYKSACEGGDPGACISYGALLKKPPAQYREADLQIARDAFMRACDAGNARGCEALGDLIKAKPFGTEADLVEALGAYIKGCEATLYQSCRGAAELTREDDPSAARMFEEKACDAASGYDAGLFCRMLAITYREDGPAGPADLAKARSANERACVKFPAACFEYADMLAKGEGGAQDDTLAREKLELACTRKCSPQAGRLLAELLRTGRGGSKDETRARQLFETSCDKGEALACLGAAEMIWLGQGGPPDDDLARARLKEACNQARDREEARATCNAKLPER